MLNDKLIELMKMFYIIAIICAVLWLTFPGRIMYSNC